MAGKPYQSSLIPYEDEIIALRRKRPPMPYSKIADLLRDKHQIVINREAIFKFIKLRMKGYKPCKYDAWDIEPIKTNNQPITEVRLLQKAPTLQTPKPTVADKPKPMVTPQSQDFEMEFSETYNLTRLPPEEAAAWLKQLEEEEKKR